MDSKNELQHHGILGMKWGKRNGPPYPLTGAAKVRAEKKAAKLRSKLADVEGSLGGQSTSTKEKSSQTPERRQQVSEYFREKNHQKKEIQKKLDSSSTKIKQMSDEELREAIARLELEKRYADLTIKQVKENKQEISQAKKLLESILYDATKNIGTQAATRMLGDLTNKLVRSMFKGYEQRDEDYVNPKKGQKDK